MSHESVGGGVDGRRCCRLVPGYNNPVIDSNHVSSCPSLSQGREKGEVKVKDGQSDEVSRQIGE